MKTATAIAQKILSGYPDYGKAPREYLLSVSEFIAHQPPELQAAMAHPTTGVASKCRFLPTIADLRQFIDDRRSMFSCTDGDSGYKRFRPGEDDTPRMEPLERRKAAVIEALGYDPAKIRAPVRKPLEPGIRDAIEDGSWSVSMLKSPPRPPSRELIQLLTEQGYFEQL